MKWIKKLEITNELYRETLDEYMASYEEAEAKIERFDKLGITKAGSSHLRQLLIESAGVTIKQTDSFR